MNLGSRFSGPKIASRYMQATELFQSEKVLELCELRERQIEQEIHSIPHSNALSLDRDTLFTNLVNLYLSDEITEYPVLNVDRAELLRESSQTTVRALYKIPWTGAHGALGTNR